MLIAGAIPTTRQASTSSSTGKRIQRGGSCGSRGRSSAGLPKKIEMKRSEYATLNMPIATAAYDIHQLRSPPTLRVSAKNISLDRKPFSSGTPAIAALATMASVAVIGSLWRRPRSTRRSRVPVSWSMMPAAMNSEALKVAWLRMWKIAATIASGVPMPISTVMRPRWLIVEYASRPLRSCWKMAMKAPSSSVHTPAPPMIQVHSGVPASAGHRRASRKTPAFTMVAECR